MGEGEREAKEKKEVHMLWTILFASGALRARVLGAVLIAAFLMVPGAVLSQTWVSNGTAVCTANDDQITPAIVSDGSGGAIIAWQDLHNGNYDIYAQRVNSSGAMLWTANGVAICTADSSQELPQIVSDGSGGAIIAWQDYRNGNYDIYAQRVNSSGVVQWTTNGVPICNAAFDQFGIAMISDGLGGAILTWEDNRSNVVNCPDIYAQRVDASGASLWTADGVSICNEASAQHGPRLVSDGSGGAIITWYDQRAGDFDIYTQRVASGGAVQWTTNGVATCTMATDQLKPDICSDGAGGVIITWYDYRATTDFNIYAQRQGPAGAIVWVVDGVVMNNNVGYDQINPKIVSDGTGGAIIVWQDYVTGTTSDIYAQRVAAAGAVLWTATGVIICTAAGDQTNPQIVTDGNSGAFITWEDYRTPNSDIYVQRIAANAAINWSATGYLICGADSDQTHPAMVSDGNLGAIVAWQDYRSGNYDIYAQRFDISGTGIEIGSPPDGSTLYLSPAYPNPSAAAVGISYSLPKSGEVELGVYDIVGQKVVTLARGVMSAGRHEVSWNAASVAAGVYFYRLSFEGTTRTNRVSIVR
jgi:predicted lipoprotein with Yx(FWY)xxD motif